MGKYRLCKCLRCGKNLDRNTEEFVVVGQRWAHKKCQEEFEQKAKDAKILAQANRENDMNEYHEIMDFARDHFNNPNYVLIQKQLKNYLNKGYKQTGILKSLIYYYDIKGNPTSKGNGGIGAVGICYEEAKQYWYKQYLIEKENAKKNIKIETEEIHIKIPKVEKKKSKFFNFLEEENNE